MGLYIITDEVARYVFERMPAPNLEALMKADHARGIFVPPGEAPHFVGVVDGPLSEVVERHVIDFTIIGERIYWSSAGSAPRPVPRTRPVHRRA